jgi:glucose-1-phosphate cytidylyltransferase
MPVPRHTIKFHSHHGINDVVIRLGYKGHPIKEYFANFVLGRSDVRFGLIIKNVEVLGNHVEPWIVTLVDTGEKRPTAGRLQCVREHLGDETYCMTYGDGELQPSHN